MFYEIVSLNGAALPAALPTPKRDWTLTGGGMLLEPPGHGPNPGATGAGFCVLSFEGVREPGGRSGRFLSMSYPYYPFDSGDLVIGMDETNPAARGRREGADLVLNLPPSQVLTQATQLRLVAAPTRRLHRTGETCCSATGSASAPWGPLVGITAPSFWRFRQDGLPRAPGGGGLLGAGWFGPGAPLPEQVLNWTGARCSGVPRRGRR